MLNKIKKTLIDSPDKLIQVLEHFGYCGVVNHNNKYISCGRDEYSSKKSIVIRLQDNDYLWVKDYPLNISKDIYSYICEQRHLEFKEVLSKIKSILGIDDFGTYYRKNTTSIFGGFYDKAKTYSSGYIKSYDEKVLDEYIKCPNKRFLKDYISIKVQNEFGIRYDVESQGIVIPIYNHLGELIAVKERMNYDSDAEGFQKYWYSYPGRTSTTLYGYSHNYNELQNNTIYIGEAEKFVLQCASYGYKNAVALMSGSISPYQIQLLLNSNPTAIIFMHDYQYDIESIKHNIELFKNYSRFTDCAIGWWDWTKSVYPEKVSPTDMGKEVFERILENEIRWEVNGETIQGAC